MTAGGTCTRGGRWTSTATATHSCGREAGARRRQLGPARPQPANVRALFLRRAAAHAAQRGEPLAAMPPPPVELQRDHAEYQRAYRQLWADRRAAHPALWAHSSSRQASDSRAWSKFRQRWRRDTGG